MITLALVALFGCSLSHTLDVDPDAAIAPERSRAPEDPPGALPELPPLPCGIEEDAIRVELPFGGAPAEVVVDLSTTIRSADVFFITDSTGSMGETIDQVRRTVASSGGLIEGISAAIPDAWFGGGSHEDFPMGAYGSSGDAPFRLAIEVTPPERQREVRDAFLAVALGSGGDVPEASTEALYQVVSGAGGSWRYSDAVGIPASVGVRGGYCVDGRFGAPCFRQGSMPILVHFTDVCSHAGPEGASAECSSYEYISPAPATWEAMIGAMRARAARYIGIDASLGGADPITSPSQFMRETARATGSVDVDGNELVFSLPDEMERDTDFVARIVGAIETIAGRVPLDVDAGARDDGSDDFDARRFVMGIEPACDGELPCLEPPDGAPARTTTHDGTTFLGVLPGSRLRFRVTLRNAVLESHDGDLGLCVDARAGGAAILDTRSLLVHVGSVRDDR